MAWRPTSLVQAGELDNTVRGWTVGWLQLDGFDEPLKLKLAGNCYPDLAGWKFRIHRIAPEPLEDDEEEENEEPRDYRRISLDQSGCVGDITADQMVRQYDMPTKELARRLMNGEKPDFQWAKCFYLEWFGNKNGRAVIQSTLLEVERIGERAFEITEGEWREQQQSNRNEMDYFMTQICDSLAKSNVKTISMNSQNILSTSASRIIGYPINC